MYPQTVVPSGDDLHTTLTNGVDVAGSGVTFTGDYYTANKNNKGWNPDDRDNTEELNPVYEYQGKRYVRVTPWAYLTENSENTYNNDGGTIGQIKDIDGSSENYRWFMVEPIKWIVLNYDWLKKGTIDEYTGDENGLYAYEKNESEPHAQIELYAADVLIGGLRFGSNSSWSTSDVNLYLNEIFYKETFPWTCIPKSKIYNNNGDGTQYNSAAYGLNFNHLANGYNQSEQKVYTLSHYELSNPDSPYVKNGVFTSGTGATSTRQVPGTDYARAHNLVIISNHTSYLTRTAYDGTNVYRVYTTGTVGSSSSAATGAYLGTRPALTMVCFSSLINCFGPLFLVGFS